MSQTKALTFRAIPVVAGKPLPEWIHVLPLGTWRGKTSMKRTLRVDTTMCSQIADNFSRRGIDIVIDWEHRTEVATTTGGDAPAAGWIDQLELREDGLWGHVKEWTPRAAEQLRAKEYRYLSAVLYFEVPDPVTGAPSGTWMPSVALTNNPFFGGALRPVIARQEAPGTGEGRMLLAYVISLLGLPETTSEEDALAGLKDKIEGGGDVPPEMQAKADLGEALMASAGWTEIPSDAAEKIAARFDEAQFVPVAAHYEELTTLRASLTAEVDAAKNKAAPEVDALVARAIEAGKVTPASKARFTALAKADMAAAKAYVDTAPVIVMLGAPNRRGPGKSETDDLTPEELAMAHAFKLDPKQVAADKRRATQKEG